MNSFEKLREAEQALLEIFSGIDAQVKHNLKRVLDAFRHHRVGAHHFAGVSGYGHDDLGRETLDIPELVKKNFTGRRSLYISAEINKGEKFTHNNVKSVRPFYGMHPKFLSKVIGKKSKKNLYVGDRLKKEYINSL